MPHRRSRCWEAQNRATEYALKFSIQVICHWSLVI
jgi:hypothetical protein